MALNKTLEEIKKLQPFITEDVDAGPRETLPARRGRQNQAIETIKRLRREYAADLRQTAAFIVVIGDKRQEFTNIAVESFKCFTANPEAFYEDLVNRIPPTLYLGKESVSNVFDVLSRHLEDKMLQLEQVDGYPQLIFKQQYQRTLRSREEFLSLVKQALVEQIGGELVGLNSINLVIDKAIEVNHTAKYAPILLPSGDERFALTVAMDLERISSRVFIVVAGDRNGKPTEDSIVVTEPDSDSVKKALKTISSSLRK